MKKAKTNSKEYEILRHSFAHILMHALIRLYDAVPGVGPAIENGFYHDFDCKQKIGKEDLKKIEDEMKKIIKEDIKIKKFSLPIDEGIKYLKKLKYKNTLELAKEQKDNDEKEISFYEQGDFVNMCKGPHVESTGKLNPKTFKLTKIAGAYWKGDEKNKMLQRIYGVAFKDKAQLKKHISLLKEAEERNHRKIAKELDLFMISPEVGQGLPIWLPNGYIIRKTLENYMLNLERKYGYEHILTPHINKKELFEKSGHLSFYQESMYSPMEIDDETYYLKPMNCPSGMMVYKMKSRSYRDLPIKMGEFGTVYRYEKTGELHGMQRVRGFTQNDAHIFCTPEQLEKQFMEVMEILERFYKDVGFKNYSYRLSLRDNEKNKYVGPKKDWEKAENSIRNVLKNSKTEFEETKGEAAFYGPKLDVQAINVFGKEDTISTIQVDFNLPERFDLNYINKNKEKKRPFVIHRALIGSFERFFAFLIEYYAGHFPLWLSPIQVAILPVSEKFNKYAEKVKDELFELDVRVKINKSNESLGKKIRESQKKKIPYMLIIGEKEEKNKEVSPRDRSKGDLGAMSLEKFKMKIIEEIKNKV